MTDQQVEQACELLEAALHCDDVQEKNYNIRQALQLLEIQGAT